MKNNVKKKSRSPVKQKQKIKVLLADDHHIVRNGIKTLLESSGMVTVVGEASNGTEAVSLVNALTPDILLSDISMPGMTGLEVAHELTTQKSKTKVMLLSMHDNEEYFQRAFENGASGYLLKDTEKEELLEAIKKVYEGKKYYGNSVSKIMMDKFLTRSTQKTATNTAYEQTELTKREKEILKHVADGLSNKQIASTLFLSIRTVDTHRFNLMHKLGAKNGVELVRIAMEKKLL